MSKVIFLLICMTFAFSDVDLEGCKGCHGQNWEDSVFGKSKIVSKMTKKEIAVALKAYKTDSENYGGTMRGVMKAHLEQYSLEELMTIIDKIKLEESE